MKFLIYGSLGGGLGGKDGGTATYEIVECANSVDALNEAAIIAKEVYYLYKGLHGLPSEDECEDEHDYLEQRDSWLDYDVVMEVNDDFDLYEWLEEQGLS